MDEQSKRKRPTYSDEFKRDAVRLVVEEGYSVKAASQAVGVCKASLRGWRAKLAPAPQPCGEDATVAELRAENVEGNRAADHQDDARITKNVSNSLRVELPKK